MTKKVAIDGTFICEIFFQDIHYTMANMWRGSTLHSKLSVKDPGCFQIRSISFFYNDVYRCPVIEHVTGLQVLNSSKK